MCEGGNVMVKISGANFDDMEEVEKELGLFLGLLLSDEERDILNEKWKESGGRCLTLTTKSRF